MAIAAPRVVDIEADIARRKAPGPAARADGDEIVGEGFGANVQLLERDLTYLETTYGESRTILREMLVEAIPPDPDLPSYPNVAEVEARLTELQRKREERAQRRRAVHSSSTEIYRQTSEIAAEHASTRSHDVGPKRMMGEDARPPQRVEADDEDEDDESFDTDGSSDDDEEDDELIDSDDDEEEAEQEPASRRPRTRSTVAAAAAGHKRGRADASSGHRATRATAIAESDETDEEEEEEASLSSGAAELHTLFRKRPRAASFDVDTRGSRPSPRGAAAVPTQAPSSRRASPAGVSGAASRVMSTTTYDEHAMMMRTCRRWMRTSRL